MRNLILNLILPSSKEDALNICCLQLQLLRFAHHLCCVHRQVCLFLKRGATQNDEDEDGQDPLSIAVQQANADIVTLYVDRHTPPVKCLEMCESR